MAFLPTIA